jgi:hypothetical protein
MKRMIGCMLLVMINLAGLAIIVRIWRRED